MWFIWLILIIAALIGLLALREHLSYYTRTICKVCDRDTGYKGNRRFKIADGYCCENCAKSANVLSTVFSGPNSLLSHNSKELAETISKINRIGKEAYEKQIRAKNEEDYKKQEEEYKKQMERLEYINSIREPSGTDDNIAKCPKCGSPSISANKKGFSSGKALVGVALTGGVGLVAGTHGANKIIMTCLKCGHEWKN